MRPHRFVAVVLVALMLVVAGAGAQEAPPTGPIRGFSTSGSAAERALEARFRALPDPASIKAFHRYFTARPHPATSARTHEVAEHIAAEWKLMGLDEVVIHRYDVLSSNPGRVRAELVAPTRYVP